jgi:hypothetical protein
MKKYIRNFSHFKKVNENINNHLEPGNDPQDTIDLVLSIWDGLDAQLFENPKEIIKKYEDEGFQVTTLSQFKEEGEECIPDNSVLFSEDDPGDLSYYKEGSILVLIDQGTLDYDSTIETGPNSDEHHHINLALTDAIDLENSDYDNPETYIIAVTRKSEISRAQLKDELSVEDLDIMDNLGLFEDNLNIDFLSESHPGQYKAPKGSTRDKKLKKAQELLKGSESDKQKAYKLRDEMEKAEREKTDEGLVYEAKKKKKKKNLSKATEAKIRKVANKKGYTFGSLRAEYVKGLGAFYSSGSRPGMTAHGWAMARVNKATPSKSWANVKKSKSKK